MFYIAVRGEVSANRRQANAATPDESRSYFEHCSNKEAGRNQTLGFADRISDNPSPLGHCNLKRFKGVNYCGGRSTLISGHAIALART
jgi:hypothetical protein